MRAYYATKLSPNISRMPNGFLVCKNVPIARTGTQDYQGSELGIAEHPGKLFKVYREESEVFNPAALASFEGVPLVDEHPPGDVTVENACNLMRGFIKDVRRGNGEDNDKMIADIIVTDPIIIAEIENGKREISCGYKCDFEPDEHGRIFQRNIRGNHVALVGKGRAGEDVAIKDAGLGHIASRCVLESANGSPEPPQSPVLALRGGVTDGSADQPGRLGKQDAERPTSPETPLPSIERRPMFMKKPNKSKANDSKGLLSKFFGILTTDADPDVVAEIAEQLVEAVEETAPIDEEPAAERKEEAAPAAVAEAPKDEGEMPAWAAQILERLERVEAACASKTPDADPLGDLEKEVAGGEENVTKVAQGEENVTKPAQEIDEGEQLSDEAALDVEEQSDEEFTIDEEPARDEGTTDARDAIVKARKQVAKIKDATTRRAVSDAMAGLIREAYGIKPSTPKGSYAAIMTAKKLGAKQMKDVYPAFDNMEVRQAAYDKRNPHKKG